MFEPVFARGACLSFDLFPEKHISKLILLVVSRISQIFAQIVFQPEHKSVRRIRFNLIADLFMLLFPIIRKSDFKIIKLILFFTLWHHSHQLSVKFNYAF